MHSTELAIENYGPIWGFDVKLGVALDDLCSSDGGQAAAQIIVADEDVLGVIGTSCSGAAVAAAALITEAGITMISACNTSPALTSDLQGNADENHNVGYYRTSHNDRFQAAAVARFVLSELGLADAAVIHDGDTLVVDRQGVRDYLNGVDGHAGLTGTLNWTSSATAAPVGSRWWRTWAPKRTPRPA